MKNNLLIGGSILNKKDLSDIRKISKLCCDNHNVISYVNNITSLIVILVEEYAKYFKINIDAEIFNRLHQNNKTSPGQVKDLYDIKEVIKFGNLREKMALIMNFGIKSCDIVIWAIATKNYLLSATFIKEQEKRLKLLTGLDILDIYHMLKCKRNNEKCSDLENTPCIFGLFTQDGSVVLSRYTDFPIINSVRFKRPEHVEIDKLKLVLNSDINVNTEEIKYKIDELLNKNKEKYSITIREIYPPLSEREKKFLDIESNTIYPPYISGYMLFDTNDKNYYNMLANHYKQIVIAGPSGSADLFLTTSKMFKSYDLNLGILSCIGWMCNIPQHSIFEILMASLPYGLIDWNPSIDVNNYVINLNDKIARQKIARQTITPKRTIHQTITPKRTIHQTTARKITISQTNKTVG